MNSKDLAVVIVALGAAGIPTLLILVTAGGLLAGFALWSVLGFLSQWMIPLIFVGAGIFAMFQLVPRGPKMALLGLGALVFFVLVGYIAWSGAFNGPANSYDVLLSLSPSSSGSISPAVSSYGIFFGALIIGSTVGFLGFYKLLDKI